MVYSNDFVTNKGYYPNPFYMPIGTDNDDYHHPKTIKAGLKQYSLFQQISLGMTKQKVERVLGRPDREKEHEADYYEELPYPLASPATTAIFIAYDASGTVTSKRYYGIRPEDIDLFANEPHVWLDPSIHEGWYVPINKARGKKILDLQPR